MAIKMSEDEAYEFLSQGTFTGKLATVRKNGKPHTSPIWFIVENKKIYFNSMNSSVKSKNIQNNPNVALTVDDQKPPYSFVIVEGKADVLNPTEEEKLDYATKIGGRYMGKELAKQYGNRNAVPDEFLIQITIYKIIAMKNVSD